MFNSSKRYMNRRTLITYACVVLNQLHVKQIYSHWLLYNWLWITECATTHFIFICEKLWWQNLPDARIDHENFLVVSRNRRRRGKALLDFERHDDDELGFRKNDIITVSYALHRHAFNKTLGLHWRCKRLCIFPVWKTTLRWHFTPPAISSRLYCFLDYALYAADVSHFNISMSKVMSMQQILWFI